MPRGRYDPETYTYARMHLFTHKHTQTVHRFLKELDKDIICHGCQLMYPAAPQQFRNVRVRQRAPKHSSQEKHRLFKKKIIKYVCVWCVGVFVDIQPSDFE